MIGFRATLLCALALVPAWGADFQEGLELKKKEKFAEAALVFEELVGKNPSDLESLEQLATMRGWLGDYDRAIETWQRALALSPDNQDFRQGLDRVLQWKAAKAAGAPKPLHWRLDWGYTYDHFGNSRGYEYAHFAQLGYRFSGKGNLWVRHDSIRAFGFLDRMTQIGGALKITPYVLFMPSIGFTPRPRFRPVTQQEAAVELLASPYIVPLLSYRHLRYADGDVHMAAPGVRLQAVPWLSSEHRFSFSRNIDGSDTNTYSARLNFIIADVWAPYLAYAHGTENIPPQRSAVVSYYSLGCVWDIDRHWAARADYTYEDRPDFYKHNSMSGALTLKW